MAELIREREWGATPLGPSRSWPEGLRTLVGVMLSSSQPMFIVWGAERTTLYNDAYSEILADKHPALGQPFSDIWEEIWEDDLKPIVTRAYAGEALHMEDMPLTMLRKGYPEQTHFSFSYTPVRGPDGKVSGFFCPCLEITDQVLEERRAHLRSKMTDALRTAGEPAEIRYAAASLVGRHLGIQQVAFASTDPEGDRLIVETEWTDGSIESGPDEQDLGAFGSDLLAELNAGRSVVLRDIAEAQEGALLVQRERGVRALVIVPQLRHGRLASILSIHSSSTLIWHPGEVAMVEEMAVRTGEAVERARLEKMHRLDEKRLQETRESLELATRTSELGWGTWNFATGKITLDPRGRAIVGLQDGEDRVADWVERTHPADRPALESEVRQCIAQERPFDLHYRVVHKDGRERHIHGTGLFEPDEKGEPLMGTGFVRDVTDLKEAEQRQKLLMAELDHRVKNILALVQSVTQLSLKQTDGGNSRVGEDLIGRINALAQAHSLLAENRWRGARFTDLIETAAAPYLAGNSGRIDLEGPDLRVGAKPAQTLGLVFHELVTNAAKYGALSQDEGTVRANWEIVPGGDGRILSFSWQERGGPRIAHPPERKGFGSVLIEGALSHELGAQVSLDFDPAGLTASFELPLDRILAADPNAAQPIRRAGTAQVATGERSSGQTILVVEDEHLVAQQVVRTLRDVGYSVAGPAGTVGDALQLAVGEDVDAAVLDINLNGEFVWPVARALQARKVPVLFSTGYSDLLEAPEDLAAVPRLMKPFQSGRLLAAISGLLPISKESQSPAAP